MDPSWRRRDLSLREHSHVRRIHWRIAGAPGRSSRGPRHFGTCRWSGGLVAPDGLVSHGNSWGGHRVRWSIHSKRIRNLQNLTSAIFVAALKLTLLRQTPQWSPRADPNGNCRNRANRTDQRVFVTLLPVSDDKLALHR